MFYRWNSSAILKLNNYLTGCTLLYANDFSYMSDNTFIKFCVIFSTATLWPTFFDSVNRTTPNTWRSRSPIIVYHLLFIQKRMVQLFTALIILDLHPPEHKIHTSNYRCPETFLLHPSLLSIKTKTQWIRGLNYVYQPYLVADMPNLKLINKQKSKRKWLSNKYV